MKELYDRQFNWIVKRLNLIIIPKEDLNEDLDKEGREKLKRERISIGLLDIFGFEVFKINSFEQFSINYTNEKLQQLYISYVFKAEEKEFINEGLEKYICELKFKDNQPVIDLMDKNPIGIFNLLDESCSVAATDENLLNKIKTQHKNHPKLTFNKISSSTFIIIHTAKNVEYSINGFRDKNKDELSKMIYDAISAAEYGVVTKIFKGLIYKNN